jgi:hypothetical protein
MDLLLGKYDIKGAADVTWFNLKPQTLAGWKDFGLRHEAEWEPIQQELIHLEESRRQYPQLRQQITDLLNEITNRIDQEIGLLPSKN